MVFKQRVVGEDWQRARSVGVSLSEHNANICRPNTVHWRLHTTSNPKSYVPVLVLLTAPCRRFLTRLLSPLLARLHPSSLVKKPPQSRSPQPTLPSQPPRISSRRETELIAIVNSDEHEQSLVVRDRALEQFDAAALPLRARRR